jgi:hypothetical protein
MRRLGVVGAVLATAAVALTGAAAPAAERTTVARCGAGWLETIDGARVLHLKGSPYELGYQQGVLLKDDIRSLVRFLFDVKAKEFGEEIGEELGKGPLRALGLKPDAKAIIRTIASVQAKHVPAWYTEELRGVADGSGLPYDEILCANFIPELFHCSGFAVGGKSTEGGVLYHGRVLDYGVDWRLQEHAVVAVVEPEGKVPFVNVTYAGFVGSVTGMNREGVSLGEMGGRGLGKWDGVPMAVLMRWALQEARSLDEAVAVFRDHPRTCEYYYVIADGETGRAVGMEAGADRFEVVEMGQSHPQLPEAVEDCVLLSAGDRYTELVRRVRADYGRIDAERALRLMDRPVAMKSNLHNALFAPASGRFWIANASADRQPAATQPYHAYELGELLAARPDPAAPDLAPPAQARTIDLGTKEGLAEVKGTWRWHDVKLVPATNKAQDGRELETLDYEPKAMAADYDDSAWEVLDPTTLGERRSAGKVCFCWYRLEVTLPEGVAGKKVWFETVVDDYGEVWVDGKLPFGVGQRGGNVVAGFNASNRVGLPDPAPGKTYEIAIFAINGPISLAPTNRIFLRGAKLEIEP